MNAIVKGLRLSGRRFGNLKVVRKQGTTKRQQALWFCKCSCGDEVVVQGNNLMSGNTTSCGCIRRNLISQRSLIDRIGKRYSKLVVIARSGSDKNRFARWLCQCDCGRQTIVRSSHLDKGRIKSCGCYNVEQRVKFCSSKSATGFLDLLAQQFSITIQREFYLEGRLFDGRVGRILIEVDSDYWHRSKKAKRVDALKDEIALRNGYAIVRMTVNEVRVVHKQVSYYGDSFEKVLRITNASKSE